MFLHNTARAVLFAVCATASCIAAAQRVDIVEFYSNADGTAQFVMMSSSPTAKLAGQTLIASSGSDKHVYIFPSDLPDVSPANGYFLAATKPFADLYSLTPDFILPDNFVFTRGVRLSAGSVGLFATVPVDLPTDGM